MWGYLRFWHDHDKFDNFTKSLKITHCGVQRLILTKSHHFWKKLIKLINHTQHNDFQAEIYKTNTLQCPLGKYFPTLVNIFTKFTEYTYYQVKEIWF